MKRRHKVPLRSREEIEMARLSGAMAADVLRMIAPYVQPGVTTNELDRICHDYIVNELKAIPGNLGYSGYPKTILTSVNHVVCHGIPSNYVLKDGDIVNIDVTVVKDGWYGDTSRMYCVGKTSANARRLVKAGYEAMRAGILAVRPGATLGDVGYAIQTAAEKQGYSVVREYCGHGIGTVYHDEPQVLNVGRPATGLVLEPGMIFTIEPMVNAGKPATKELDDGWTVVTKDGALSVQWEHMVAVTESGFDILTSWPDGYGDYASIGPGIARLNAVY